MLATVQYFCIGFSHLFFPHRLFTTFHDASGYFSLPTGFLSPDNGGTEESWLGRGFTPRSFSVLRARAPQLSAIRHRSSPSASSSSHLSTALSKVCKNKSQQCPPLSPPDCRKASTVPVAIANTCCCPIKYSSSLSLNWLRVQR